MEFKKQNMSKGKKREWQAKKQTLTVENKLVTIGEQQSEAEGEAGSPPSKESDVGLNPRTLGSQPEPKTDA